MLEKQIEIFAKEKEIKRDFNATNALIMVINPSRQIVFANQSLYDFIKISDADLVLGRRLGEVVRCIHSDKEITGCGTSVYCTECTALEIMKKSIATNTANEGEAVITYRLDDNELPLNVYEHIQPIEIKGDRYYVISLMDVSDRVKKRFLERIFFHDILNTAGALKGFLRILHQEVQAELREEVELVKVYFDYVIDEIQAQKQILEAENKELQLDWITLNSIEVLQSVKKGYHRLEEYKDHRIAVDQDTEDMQFKSDFIILRRILSNMLKNALEASTAKDPVILGCNRDSNGKHLVFWVKNSKYIKEEVQKRIFQRSYSTKGKGRGLGTYSIKLLGEKYLNGKVTFTSEVDQGTIFYLKIPIHVES